MIVQISGRVFYWKGPAPHSFVADPEAEAREIKALERLATYGWGMIPVTAQIGDTVWRTSLWPKDGVYIIALKSAVRKSEILSEGSDVQIRLEIG